MSAFFEGLRVWKLALLKAFLLCLIAGANTFSTAMAGVQWEDLTRTEQILIFNGIFLSIAGALVAFLDKTMSRVSEGKSPFGTEFIKKT